jgi:glycosyltransferase involved in cell wall biosynthesis
MPSDKERQKWDQYYASHHQVDEPENIRQFRDEFVGVVQSLLPEGGGLLEAGCGAGEQSLALAGTGAFDITLMDFSTQAIKLARQCFASRGLDAQFEVQDVSQPGVPEYDLVFNAGVLEHYSFDEQAGFLRGMASRSRKFVLVLVPNFQNYWYWVWRIQKSSQDSWPFGKEIPAFDLGRVFDAAGLHYFGSAYLGASWTESFIEGLDGISDELKNLLLEIHTAGLLPKTQTSYLLAALGSVEEIAVPQVWQGFSDESAQLSMPNLEVVSASLADALAIKIGDQQDSQQWRAEFNSQISALGAQIEQLQQTHGIDLVERVREIEVQSADILETKTREIEREQAEVFAQRLQDSEQRYAEALVERISEIERNRVLELEEKITQLENIKTDALLDKLRELENQQTTDFITELREYERQRDIDQMGVIRQIEHDHTGVLVGKIQEIEFLRKQTKTLSSPPTLNLRSFAAQWYHRSKSILKRARHFSKKIAPQALGAAQISYQAPLSLGHPRIPAEQRVVILSYTFFDFDGNNMYHGGAERYVLELARLIRGMGYYPEVYQCGNGYWVRYYGDLRVTGIDVGGQAHRLADVYRSFDHAQALTIFSPFSLAQVPEDNPAVGISHGVFWDYAEIQSNPTAMQDVYSAGKHLDAMVSVDTNTINALRASAATLSEKFEYIPNFVDVDAFDISPDAGDDQKIVVLYPRRLYRPRGFWLAVDVLPEILEKYPQVEFHFVGRADRDAEEHINELMVRYPGRIRWYWLSPDEMPGAYQQADITIIPTVHSEGTSLSCLEALASGNAVIATHVGGLPNLILPGFNGLLIEPSAAALADALRMLIGDQELRQKFARRGRDVALSFSIETWRAQWKELLGRYLTAKRPQSFDDLQAAFFPSAPGIPWEGIQQRPHHLAAQLARSGIETFWQDVDSRTASPNPLLHILGPEDEVNIQRPLVMIYYPFHYRLLDSYDDPVVVYDVLDDISIHAASDRSLPEGERALDYHHRLLKEADVVITSSQVLYQQIKPVRPDVILVPNGIDREHFRYVGKADKAGSNPLIGFHGAIAEWFDVDLLCEVARLRPDYKFELIGPLSVEIETFSQIPNIQYREAVPYEDVPQVISRFNVGILPFKLNPMTHAVRPLKVLEYLAMGVPVVAVPLNEIRHWPGLLFADSPDTFVQQIERALDLKAKLVADQEILDFVAAAAWENTAVALLERLKKIV